MELIPRDITTLGPKLTPMMEQYRSIKKTLSSDTILFFRLGDFYEMFFDDATKAAEILNITLTGREAGEAGRVPMCGIPYHSFQGYVKTLVENNLKVAICEQVGDPKASKGLVERKISRVISPATYLEDDSKGARADYMAALVKNGDQVGLAYLELSTGDFFVRRFSYDKISHELSLLDPRELILPKSLAEFSPLISFITSSLKVSLSYYEDWVFESSGGLQLLKEVFHVAVDRGLSFSDEPLLVGAAGAVLYYLRDHFHTTLGHIRFPEKVDASEVMVLDRQTQRSLELVSNLNQEKGGPTLLHVIDQTLTPMGTRALRDWMTHPLLVLESIQERQEGVSEFLKNSEALSYLRNLFLGIKDIERTVSRLNCGVANARDLVNLKLFLGKIPDIKKRLGDFSSKQMGSIAEQIKSFPEIQELLESAIIEEPPLGLKDGGLIRDHYSLELDELRGFSRKGKDWLIEFEKREIERTGIKSLKVKYSQVFGYTIDISNANRHLAPSDYIRKQTLSNAERFIVPELVDWDQKISGAEDKIKTLEYQIFQNIRLAVLEHLVPLQNMARSIGFLDALAALAFVALQKRWAKPILSNTDELRIEGGRHPVVESMIPSGQFVENDTFLDGKDSQLIVLTGPNMSGKSTYIRQIAQIVLLAQMGSYVPARNAIIGIVDRIFTRIGAADDLARGESTFMVEMLETAHILRSATSKSLLILDEVGRGTSTFDGVSIAWAICEFLASGKIKPRTLFATHYHELTQLEEHFSRIKNYQIAVREAKEGITFLRKVVRGGSDRSYGIHVAKLAGIPEEVTRRANQILKVLENENLQATRILEGVAKKYARKDDPDQPSLFNPLTRGHDSLETAEHPLIQAVRDLDMNDLTPIQALNKLFELKQLLEKESPADKGIFHGNH